MKPLKAKPLTKREPVSNFVKKRSGSKPPEKRTRSSPEIDRKLTELLARAAAYGYWHGLFSHANREPYPEVQPQHSALEAEIQAAIHIGYEEGRGRRTGEKNKPMTRPRPDQESLEPTSQPPGAQSPESTGRQRAHAPK